MSKGESTIEIDLQNLSSLSKEVEKLEKRKTNLLHELEEIEKKRIPWEREVEKNIEIKEAELLKKVQERHNELDKVEKKIKSDEKLVTKRLEESEAIEQQMKNLDAKQKALVDERKELDALTVLVNERDHRANLLIGQYTKKLNELGEIPIPEEPKEDKKKDKK